MQRGYVKVWRKISDAGWFKNHKLCTLWLWCLMKASHKDHDMIVGCQQVHLNQGEFIFGLKAASDELAMSVQSIRTLLDFLKTTKNVTIKSTNKFSIVSIVNWNTYQLEENEINNQINKPLTNKQQTTNKPLTTNNNGKNDKNEKNKEYIVYGEQKNIQLTEDEYLKLISFHGEILTSKSIQYLSNYKVEKNYKTKSDYLTIKRWVIDAVKDKGGNNANTASQGFSTNSYRRNNQDRGGLKPETEAELDRIAREYNEHQAKKASLCEAEKIPGANCG